MTKQEFVDFFNYECVTPKSKYNMETNSLDKVEVELDDETLEALRYSIDLLFLKHVDDLEEVPQYEFIDKSGRIKLI